MNIRHETNVTDVSMQNVICIKSRVGQGISSDPLRIISEYFRSDGTLIARVDPVSDMVEKEANRVGNISTGNGVAGIARERVRQVVDEWFGAVHDSAHTDGELALAAAAYALMSRDSYSEIAFSIWPFEAMWLKTEKHSRIKKLVIAGALIAAEIDRIVDNDYARGLELSDSDSALLRGLSSAQASRVWFEKARDDNA